MLSNKEIQFVTLLTKMLDERQLRLALGAYSLCLGYGGVTDLSNVTGISRTTITRGKNELDAYLLNDDVHDDSCLDAHETSDNNRMEDNSVAPPHSDGKLVICKDRIRKPGAGRKSTKEHYPSFSQELSLLLDGNVIGNPENPLCWTTKSLHNLKDGLREKGINVSHETIATELKNMGFSLQQNRKYAEAGNPGPDRDEQFQFINNTVKAFLDKDQPVISIDAKKKELIGNYKNGGSEYRPKKNPLKVNDHDFLDQEKGKAAPYGVYDIGKNEGFVNVGISSDTAEFAVNSIRNWWNTMGKSRYPHASELMINADCGGSNGRRSRLFKKCMQDFSNETGLVIHISHFPPGTSKWNKIEHRLFSQISKNWRGRPLESLEVIINLIGSTKTKEGLTVRCMSDDRIYKTGIKVSDEEFSKLHIIKKEWHGEWNYMIIPNRKDVRVIF